MKIHNLSLLSPEAYAGLLKRGDVFDPDTMRAAGDICRDVRERGDAALREYSERFDRVAVDELRVGDDERARALRGAPDELLLAIERAAANIRAFHAAQLRPEPKVETMPGVVCWRERRPIERVGLYVPAGSAPLPSTVLMLGVPALLAGSSRVILCSPPRPDGCVDPAVLAAAGVLGIDEIYKVGGAQAIAAMAYGTRSVPRVEKVFGPGNRFVAAAKQIVAADPDGAAIDLLAGPSELLLLADASADPRAVAADLLSQAEHDPDAQVVLVTTSKGLIRDVLRAIPALAAGLARRAIIERSLAGSHILIVDSLDAAVGFINDYAPEHLIINVEGAELVLGAIGSAGSIFIGPYAPVTAGDYASGTNHTLPTGGSARWLGGVSVESFRKLISVQSISLEGLRALAPTLLTLADAEGLDAHRQAVAVRLD